MAKLYIEDKQYAFPDGRQRNLLDVCLSLGFNVPYFCWHPALKSVGACRQCAVKLFKNDADKQGRIVMSCMTPATDGARISIDDRDVVAFRAKVIEWLMVNHPHDCPVCDEGGECHLQDMTVMTGHTYRHSRFAKRTHRNQDLGPFVNHEMNRCIQCYRCVRFYRDYAGEKDLEVLGWHDHVYFGRHGDGVLASEFSGNLVEVCPTGVFTDKSLKRHYARKWDLQTAPSVCVNCGLGCNTIAGERYGTLRRVQARYHREVNGYFLCDRGRYGYEFVNSDRRIRRPVVCRQGQAAELTADEAMEHLRGIVRGARLIGIGSDRASLESNFALRQLVGAEDFYCGMTEGPLRLARLTVEVLKGLGTPAASLHDVAACDAALVLGEDVLNTAPMLGLALRQTIMQAPIEAAKARGILEWDDAAIREAIQEQRGALYIATPDGTKLDADAAAVYRAAPADLARLGLAVAHAIDPNAPAPQGELAPAAASLAGQIAQSLLAAKSPLVVSGPLCQSEEVIRAAANVVAALAALGRSPRLCLGSPNCNTLGAALMGGGSLDAAQEAIRKDPEAVLVVLENDLYRQLGDAAAEELLACARHVIVIEHLANATTAKAEVVLPAATFAESAGTLVNNEGRAQRFEQVFAPGGDIQPGWRWLGHLSAACLRGDPWGTLDEVLSAMAREMPVFGEVPHVSPPAGFRMVDQRIPRQSHRASGRTAVTANVSVHEPAPPSDADSPMSFSMEGFDGQPPSSLIARFWSPGWNSQQAINKFQTEIAGVLRMSNPGRRLIPADPKAKPSYFPAAEPAFVPRANQWLVVPSYHIFGSEELSLLSPGISQRAPAPYVGVSPGDAHRLLLRPGQTVEITIGQRSLRAAVLVRSELPDGLATLPVHLRGLWGVALPDWAVLAAAGDSQEGLRQ